YDPAHAQTLTALRRLDDDSVYAAYETDTRGNVIRRTQDAGTPRETSWRYLYDGGQRLRRADGPESTELYYYSGSDRVLAVEHTRGPGGALGDIVRVRRWFGGAELHYSPTERTRTWQHVTLGEKPVARIEN